MYRKKSSKTARAETSVGSAETSLLRVIFQRERRYRLIGGSRQSPGFTTRQGTEKPDHAAFTAFAAGAEPFARTGRACAL